VGQFTSESSQTIAQLDANVPRNKRVVKVRGTEKTETIYAPLVTEQDWDEYHETTIRDYSGFPDISSNVEKSFRKSKEVFNQRVIKDLQAELKIDAEAASNIVDVMNSSNEVWLDKQLSGKEQRALKKIGATDKRGPKKGTLVPDAGTIGTRLRFGSLEEAEAADVPANAWVLIDGVLRKNVVN